MSLPRPTPIVAVAHSPTPSTVRIAASRNGEGKNALAACDSWCSAYRTGPFQPSASRIVRSWNSFSFIQSGPALRNEVKPRGAVPR